MRIMMTRNANDASNDISQTFRISAWDGLDRSRAILGLAASPNRCSLRFDQQTLDGRIKISEPQMRCNLSRKPVSQWDYESLRCRSFPFPAVTLGRREPSTRFCLSGRRVLGKKKAKIITGAETASAAIEMYLMTSEYCQSSVFQGREG